MTEKFTSPRVTLIDCPAAAFSRLEAIGYRVSKGTLGTILEFNNRPGLVPVKLDYHVPSEFEEQDVVVIDLGMRPAESIKNQVSVPPRGFFVEGKQRFADPRPIAMHCLDGKVIRIFDHGGVVVIFLAPPLPQSIAHGDVESGKFFESRNYSPDFFNRWHGFPTSTSLQLDEFEGSEILPSTSDNGVLDQFLRDRLIRWKALCTVSQNSYPGYSSPLTPILENKYGKAVGMHLIHPTSNGQLILLPQTQDEDMKALCCERLVNDVLPALVPSKYPDHAHSHWISQPDYEHMEVIQKQAEIQSIQELAESQIGALNADIDALRDQMAWIQTLRRLIKIIRSSSRTEFVIPFSMESVFV